MECNLPFAEMPRLTLMGQARNGDTASVYNLREHLTPGGYLDFPDPFSLILSMVMVSFAQDQVHVHQRTMPPALQHHQPDIDHEEKKMERLEIIESPQNQPVIDRTIRSVTLNA